MFVEKSVYPASNLHLPPIDKSFRRRIRPPPTPSFTSRAAKAAHIAENVSALKAKYMDYTTWLKTSTRYQREPVLTQELLKNSLCHMGIDSGKAEQLVSTCSWYVYQFQKELKIDPDQMNSIEKKKLTQYKSKLKKTTLAHDNTEDSTTTINDDPSPPTSRHHQYLLPPIHPSDLSPSSRFRRVDFNDEQRKYPIPKFVTSNKIRLKPLATASSHFPPAPSLTSSTSSRTLHRHAGQTRSILRKQYSSSSSNVSTEVVNPISTPISTIPLGTRSQRLFGGSECFAQIMNELEQQKK